MIRNFSLWHSWFAFSLLGGVASAQSLTTSETAALGAVSISRGALPLPSASNSAVQAYNRPMPYSLPRANYSRYPWKLEIMATVFWIGENTSENNPVANHQSSWDAQWEANYGGIDDPDPNHRTVDFHPANFVPRQNPFYVALPYNDVSSGRTKDEATRMIPWFKEAFKEHGKSICHDRWLALRFGERVCYAQWSDCGPFVTDDCAYVFGTARPSNTKNDGAGIDISPAVRDFLGMAYSGGKCDWRFVDLHEVPDGPWRRFGDNNHFVKAAKSQPDQDSVVASRLEELRKQRDEWFRANGNSQYQSR